MFSKAKKILLTVREAKRLQNFIKAWRGLIKKPMLLPSIVGFTSVKRKCTF